MRLLVGIMGEGLEDEVDTCLEVLDCEVTLTRRVPSKSVEKSRGNLGMSCIGHDIILAGTSADGGPV